MFCRRTGDAPSSSNAYVPTIRLNLFCGPSAHLVVAFVVCRFSLTSAMLQNVVIAVTRQLLAGIFAATVSTDCALIPRAVTRAVCFLHIAYFPLVVLPLCMHGDAPPHAAVCLCFLKYNVMQ